MRLLQVGRLLAGLAGLLGCATAYGMCVWIVFVTGPARTGATPRWQLPAVERVVAGVYCRAMAWCVGGAALGHFVDLRSSGKCEGYNLLVSLLMVLVNLLYLKPRATKVRIVCHVRESLGCHRNTVLALFNGIVIVKYGFKF